MRYLGIDVAGSDKGQAVAVLDDELTVIHLAHGQDVLGLVERMLTLTGPEAIVAIDAPRSPARSPEKGGRECERQLHQLGLRVQWSPKAGAEVREWMANGFALFKESEGLKQAGRVREVLEVFPSASYERLPPVMVKLPLADIDRRAKADQLDAVCCAVTAWCFAHGQYLALGDPTEGCIVVPKKV